MALYEYPTNKATRPAHITGSMVKTPLTGVDASTSWTLSFSPSKDTRSTLAAQAILSTNIHVKQHSPAVVIRYQHGVIEIPSPPYAPKGFTVTYFDPNKDLETKEFPVDWQGGGWHFQADEVARCVRDGKLESDLWGWNKSLLEMDVFDEVGFRIHLFDYILNGGVSYRCVGRVVTSSRRELSRLFRLFFNEFLMVCEAASGIESCYGRNSCSDGHFD